MANVVRDMLVQPGMRYLSAWLKGGRERDAFEGCLEDKQSGGKAERLRLMYTLIYVICLCCAQRGTAAMGDKGEGRLVSTLGYNRCRLFHLSFPVLGSDEDQYEAYGSKSQLFVKGKALAKGCRACRTPRAAQDIPNPADCHGLASSVT
jgi:hypothetical protein